ncbi:hypothetical protein WS63_12795 [Burkholderia stagnalis]|nr:hypothetical protein WS63_12795 [Burkholderia stagnalis]
MDARMLDMLNRVFDKIDSLSPDEFSRKLAEYEGGELTRALVELHQFFEGIHANVFVRHARFSVSDWDVAYEELVALDAANDDYFMMAA